MDVISTKIPSLYSFSVVLILDRVTESMELIPGDLRHKPGDILGSSNPSLRTVTHPGQFRTAE